MILFSSCKILLLDKEELEDFSIGSVRDNGDRVWNDKDGRLHREDGPAVITDTWQGWFIEGLYHREDGPAYISSKGKQCWFLHGEEVTEEIVRALGKMK